MRHKLPLLIAAAAVFVAGSAFAAAPYFGPGSYQGWDIDTAVELKDDGVAPDAAAGDGIYTASVMIATAGAYEWKAAEAAWAASWPGSGNCWFITTADNQEVVLTFDENAYGDGWWPDSFWPHSDATVGGTYTLVGSLGDELGGSDWNPGGALFMLDDGLDGDVVAGDGIFTLCGTISTAGSYEWKVAVNGDWAQQFGADGPGVNSATVLLDTAADNEDWCFELDTNTGRIRSYPSGATPVDPQTWGKIKVLYR